MEKICDDCKYYEKVSINSSSGLCKRYPPVLDYFHIPERDDILYEPSDENPEKWVNPRVLETEFCGEWKEND